MKKIGRRGFLNLCQSAGMMSLFPYGTPIYLSGFQDSINISQEGSTQINPKLPKNVQEFPSLTLDENDNPWIAVLERDIPNKKIKIFNYRNKELHEVAKMQPKGITGISAPSITAMGDAIIVTFSIEKNGRWDVAYAIMNTREEKRSLEYNIITNTGSINITPIITAGKNNAHVLWESNSGGRRGIYSCQVDKEGYSEPQRLTSTECNSYNPAIVALPNGNVFAAWDSLRNDSADIYGAWYKNGDWQPEVRLTSDCRIEKHPYLTNKGNEVWMCWEAQSYEENYSNNITEQRVVVANVQDEKLYVPKHLFQVVSPNTDVNSQCNEKPGLIHYNRLPQHKYNLLRPQIAFDKNGTLWLSAREFMNKYDGPKPVIWNYRGDKWSDKMIPFDQNGKRQPVGLAFGENEGFAVYQYDNLYIRDFTFGWKSGFGISELPTTDGKRRLITEPLKMPPSSFSLAENIRLSNAKLPRQNIKHNGENLSLFFGDLHNHTDLSICRRSWNPTAKDLFETNRDIEKLDFCASTDHGYNLDAPQWDFLGEQVRCNQDDKSFVTFLANEWTSDHLPPGAPKEERMYGHRNLIFSDPYYQHFYNSRTPDDKDPHTLWEQMQKDGADFICIPHQLADMGTNIPIDWRFVSEEYQPVAEIFQGRGSYEYIGCPRQAIDGANFRGNYIQDVWEQGNIIGIIASPDHWGGIGKAAVWAKELSRESIFEAIRARHTYGTTGSKIGLMFKTEQAIMGDKVSKSSDHDYKFQIKALALNSINEVVIFRNNRIVHRSIPKENQVDFVWEDLSPVNDFSWYYTRIQCVDSEIAWSSPIWFV